MKRFLCLIVAVFLVISVTGCNNSTQSGKNTQNKSKTVADVINEKTGQSSQPQNDDNTSQNNGSANGSSSSNISSDDLPKADVDLTVLSSTMVYSEVYNMMQKPEKYIGKTVKMYGQFTVYHSEETGIYYYACVIADATACCQQGLEFVLEGEHNYPDDYPQIGSNITVVGEFETYMEGEARYCHLKNAKLIK